MTKPKPRDRAPRLISMDVAGAIADLGRATIDELHALFPSLTRIQVHSALSAAKRAGVIGVVDVRPTRGTRVISVWGLSTPEGAVVSRGAELGLTSVFDLASGPVAIPAWKQPARECHPLGGWE